MVAVVAWGLGNFMRYKSRPRSVRAGDVPCRGAGRHSIRPAPVEAGPGDASSEMKEIAQKPWLAGDRDPPGYSAAAPSSDMRHSTSLARLHSKRAGRVVANMPNVRRGGKLRLRAGAQVHHDALWRLQTQGQKRRFHHLLGERLGPKWGGDPTGPSTGRIPSWPYS